MPGMKCNGYRPGIQQQPYTKWDTHKDEVEVDYKSLAGKHRFWFSGRKGYVLRVLLVLVVFSIGLILGYVIRRNIHELIIAKGRCPYRDTHEGYNKDLSDEFRRYLDPESIKENLRNYTSVPHQTGVHNNNILGEILRSQMEELGIKVKTPSYDVLLSYPDYQNENTISLIDPSGEVHYATQYRGPHLDMHPEFSAYMAFSPSGEVTGDLVYANFGTEDDFNVLHQSSVLCEGNIVIMRYGRIGIQEKLLNAAACGSNAVILYTDPAQVKAMHTKKDELFPNSWWLPGWAVRRASILNKPGDPLTPDLPATEGIHRLAPEDADLPVMLVQSIGYEDAHELMMAMTGPIGPTSFMGGMHINVTYRLGPGYTDDREGWKVKMNIHNEEETRSITNVIGVIEGREEPDRYVIVGCHYDAWLYGGVDPNSGTAILMELAKAFSNLTEAGWQPRRSILLAHWDGGEQGHQGAYEWVEENEKLLYEGAVAYINLDAAVTGSFSVMAQATPPLRELILNIAQMLKPADPEMETMFDTLYDEWMVRNPDPNDNNIPRVSDITYDSDHAPFIYKLNLPSVWTQYSFDELSIGISTYPGYHTAVDNSTYVEQFIDPDFHAHHRLAELVGELVLQLSLHSKLPYNLREYAFVLGNAFDQLQASLMQNGSVHKLVYLEWAVGNFSEAVNIFMDDFENTDLLDVLALRRKNDKIIQVSRAFLNSRGLPKQPQIKNVLFAPSAFDFYQEFTFTGIRDAAFLWRADGTKETQQELQLQLSAAITSVRAATSILMEALVS